MIHTPKHYQALHARALTSRAAATKAMCLECVGWVRADVRDCPAENCPLHRWRPYTPGARAARPKPPKKAPSTDRQ